MMIRRFLAITILLIASYSAVTYAGDDFHSLFSRGISIHDAMNWASMNADKSDYIDAPFSDAAHPFSTGELETIRKAGFNFIRLTVDVGPFLKMTGPHRDALDALLLEQVHKALAADLSVIVDFHPVSQVKDYSPASLVADPESPIFHRYCDLATHTAALLEGVKSPRVALELMNEPQIGWSKSGHDKWQQMLEKLYGAARRGSPKLALILTGGDGGSAAGLINVDPTLFLSDPQAILTFHFYLPYDFTLQSVGDDNKTKLELDIPYPADERPTGDSLDALKKSEETRQVGMVAATGEQARALALLEAYHLTHFSKRTIDDIFHSVQQWAQLHKLPPERVLVGEFGVTRRYGHYHGARDEERAAWMSDVREAAEQNHFSWGIWVYRGYGGMAAVRDDNTEDLDPVTIRALKLNQQ